MILHDVHYSRFNLQQEDTLAHPQHLDFKFEAVVANPPFSAEWSSSALFLSDDRFSPYGRLAPSSKADFAFVQHMLYHLADNGTMAVVLPHGVLFRSGAESHIRQHIIDRNYLDAVIGLPPNIFYGTGIPTCILVFKKLRVHSDDVIFIDSSQYFERATQNYLRQSDIDKIISTYRGRRSEAKYSHIASLKEIRDNDCNLNIARYVDTFEGEDTVDLNRVTKELKELEKAEPKIDRPITEYCRQLKIKTPF